jgi:hypothetical protein
LAGLEIFLGRCSDLAGEVTVWARSNLDLSVVVPPPVPVGFRRGCARHCDAAVEQRIRIVEDIAANRSGRRTVEVAECVHRILSGMPLPEGGGDQALHPRAERPWELRELFPESTRLEMELRFEAQIFLPMEMMEQ